MVKIRLKRMGKHKSPFYRVVVAESSVQRDGKVIEELGYYNPKISPNEKQLKEAEFDAEKYKSWISKGAQPTLSVKKIAKKLGIA